VTRLLLDESVPVSLRHSLNMFDVETVAYRGWTSFSDLRILDLAQSHFDVFVTADKNIPFQVNTSQYDIAIIVLPTNKLSELLELREALASAIRRSRRGTVMLLNSDDSGKTG
jgi:predicted nuclease of predicted toxin-antitoxin system